MYCSVDSENIHWLKYYTCVNDNEVTVEYKYNVEEKFTKILCEITWKMDEFQNVRYNKTITSSIYLKEYIKKRLIPFINTLFWSDMVTCHYGKLLTNFLQGEKCWFHRKRQNFHNAQKYDQLKDLAFCKRKKVPHSFNQFRLT